MSLLWGHFALLLGPFAADRMDTWVLKVSLAIVGACLAGLVLWQLLAYLSGKVQRKRRVARESPEPPVSNQAPKVVPRVPAAADLTALRDDPERLQQACTVLENSLADIYVTLADSWVRHGQPQKAAAALQKILRICPEGSPAQLARDQLRKMGHEVGDHSS